MGPSTLKFHPRLEWYLLGLVECSGPSGDHWWAMYTPGELLPPPSPPHPPTPFNIWAKIDAHLQKNRLKRLKIKQGTTSKVSCILFNRLLSLVVLNNSGLVHANAGNINLKSLNRCFSNYYQARTRHVFANSVTNKPLFWLCQFVVFSIYSLRTYRYNIGVHLRSSQVSREILNAAIPILGALLIGHLLNYVSQFSNGGGHIHGLKLVLKAPTRKAQDY